MNTVELGRKIADFVSEYGDEYEIKDQMNNDETKDEYIDRLGDETAAMLETYSGASVLLSYLENYLENPETEQAAKNLIDGIQEKLNEYDKNTEDAINELIGNDEADLFFDMLESTDFELRSNNDGTYQIYDTVNNEVYEESVSTASEAVDALSTYVADNTLDGLERDARYEGISNIPTTCDEWKGAVTRPDLQEFIKGHESEIAEVLLIADPKRMDEKINMAEITEGFVHDKDITE